MSHENVFEEAKKFARESVCSKSPAPEGDDWGEKYHPILSGVKFVVDNSKHVEIVYEKLCEFIEYSHRLFQQNVSIDPKVHFNDGTWRAANYLAALDAMNFCFWPNPGEIKWTIVYKNEFYSGYMGLAASLTRAIEWGTPVFSAEFMKHATRKDLDHIFHGNCRIPLFDQRLVNLNIMGIVLCESYDGQFRNFVEEHGPDALNIALEIGKILSFKDETFYKNKSVRFYKRAQILVADLYTAFEGKGIGNLKNIDRITAFADYKIPQILRELGILKYDEELTKKIDEGILIPSESEEEIEIRANMVWAVELIRRELEKVCVERNAFEIDYVIWMLSKTTKMKHPHHLTRTIYY